MFLLLLALLAIASPKQTPPCNPESSTHYFVPAIEDTLVAVHYYPWYRTGPEDCSSGSDATQWCDCIFQLKGVKPSRGFYGSNQKQIVLSQLDEMMDAGVDIVSVEWEGKGRALRNFVETFLPALSEHNRKSKDDMKFVLLYDLSLRLRRSEEIQFDDLRTRREFVRDFEKFAGSSRYFRNSNYLVFDNKPVVYLYVTRGIRGSDSNLADAFEGVQRVVRTKRFSGVSIVADHLYWGKINYNRIRLMNVAAITSFAPLDSTQGVLQKATSDYRPIRMWADKLAALYGSAKSEIQSSNLPIDIQPGIFAQYDDLEKDTAACDPTPPRRKAKAYHLVDGSDWEYMIQKGIESRQVSERDYVLPSCQEVRQQNFGGKSIIWIYSYNEWGEGSGIEQVQSKSKQFPYGFGAELLTILRNKFQQ